MENEPRMIKLTTLAQGVAEELFQDGMMRVTDNIADVNTDARAKRVITLRFEITPDEERKQGDILVTSAVKLASVKGMRVGLYFGRHQGSEVAVEAISQQSLFTTPEAKPRLLKPAEGEQP